MRLFLHLRAYGVPLPNHYRAYPGWVTELILATITVIMPASEQPHIALNLFGGWRLSHSEHGPIRESRRKVQALFVWLQLVG